VEKKSKGGRPTSYSKVDLRQVELLAGLGLTEEQIASIQGISWTSLKTYKKQHAEFLAAIKHGKEKAEMQITKSLFQVACNGNLGAMIFWLCNRAPERWHQLNKVERNVSGETKLEIEHVFTNGKSTSN